MKNILYLFLIPFLMNAQSKSILFKEEGKESAYPRVSKDGSSVVFQSNRGGKWQIYAYHLAEKKLIRLTTDTFNNNFPDWSADNRFITFVSDRHGNEEIYVMNKDGSETKRLTENPSRDIHPYFSPDGKYLLFNSDRGNGSLDIYRLTLSDNKVERITDTPDNETCARYSPDMKQIVYLRNNSRMDDVFTMSMINGLTDNLTQTPVSTDGWPIYSADGKRIYFSSMEKGNYAIFRINTDGKNKEQVTFPETNEEHARVFVSSDPKKIIYNIKSGTTISIVEQVLKN